MRRGTLLGTVNGGHIAGKTILIVEYLEVLCPFAASFHQDSQSVFTVVEGSQLFEECHRLLAQDRYDLM